MQLPPRCEAGFIIHDVTGDPAYTKARLVKRFSRARFLPAWLIHHFIMPRLPVYWLKWGFALDVESEATGKKVNIIFWVVPFDPEQMMKKQPINEIVEAGVHCSAFGAQIVGLGAFTSIVGGEKRGGVAVAEALNKQGVSVTTGNSLTAVTGVEGLLTLATKVGYDPSRLTVAVIGARGSTGSICAELLSPRVGRLVLATKRKHDLVGLVGSLNKRLGEKKVEQLSVEEALSKASLIITVTSATEPLEFDPRILRRGAIVCDIARPRNIAKEVAQARSDVLVFEGSILRIPGPQARLTFDIGFPPKTAYACMAETMILALEGRTNENYSLGQHPELNKALEIWGLAQKHGFTLAGWRSFDRELADEAIERFSLAHVLPLLRKSGSLSEVIGPIGAPVI